MKLTEYIAVGVGFALLALLLNSCSLMTTPLRDCDKMCDSKAAVYEDTKHGQRCQCNNGVPL